MASSIPGDSLSPDVGLKGQLGQLFPEALKPIVSTLGTLVEGCLVWARCQAPEERLDKLYDHSWCLSSGCDTIEMRTRDQSVIIDLGPTSNLDLGLN